MKGFIRVGRVTDFAERGGRAIRLGDVKVAVFRVGERWYAIQDRCPHMGASLAEGKLEDCCVICHWHGRRFDLENGRSDMRSGARAAVYPVRVEDGDVYVGDPRKAGSQKDRWTAK